MILSVLLLFIAGGGYFILYWVAISMSKTIIIIGARTGRTFSGFAGSGKWMHVKLVSSLPSERAQSVMAEGVSTQL